MQKSVLLGFVETVDLVDEKNSAAPMKLTLLARLFDDLADLAHTGQHGGKLHEMGQGGTGQKTGQGRFAAARRPPEDHGKDPVPGHGVADQGPGSDNAFMAHKFVQVAGPHPLGQGDFSPALAGRLLE